MLALRDSLSEAQLSPPFRGFNKPAEAIDALRNGCFDLLLSDLMMPETDGIHLLKQALQIDPNLDSASS